MYQFKLHQHIQAAVQSRQLDIGGTDQHFFIRLAANASAIHALFQELYQHHPAASTAFDRLIDTMVVAHQQRNKTLQEKDLSKQNKGTWFLSNEITGMSLYVDRFCGKLSDLPGHLDHLKNLGVNLVHLMPVFESPKGASDGGYAVSDFRQVDPRFGKLNDLQALQQQLLKADMYLMLDIVLNHTSDQHEWALQAKKGNKPYQDYYYLYPDRNLPDQFDATMPDIFPESAPGNFTYVKECDQWAMTVFHNYQWDLNYTNPVVFIEMLDNIFFYANLGVDILRIDAPAFIWKQLGTTCQNLPQAHQLLQLIKQCVQVATPGMALLGEAIVAPQEILKYFGTGLYTAKECDFAYHATQMALQWDALATGDTRVMLAAQPEMLQKPPNTSWITYTRCHDDIGLGYDDSRIQAAGYNAYEHRKYLKEFYSGTYPGSPARGALFSVNPKNQDARISGSLASLCGLEKAILEKNETAISESIQKIILMQAHSFFIGGVPMLFYGDEMGYTNDYSYQQDPAKSYDNRWMHRPVMDWEKNKKITQKGSIEQRIYAATQQLILLRRQFPVLADLSNLSWLTPHNIHIAGMVRTSANKKIYALFNYSNKAAYLTWYAFKEHGQPPHRLYDHWNEKKWIVGGDYEYLVMEPYSFCLLETMD